MKNSFIALCVLFILILSNTVCAQDAYLRMFKTDSKKEYLIKEGHRVKLKTEETGRVKGRFSIVDENHIILDGRKIALNDITKMKRSPYMETFLLNGNLYFWGGALVGQGLGFFAYSGDSYMLGAALVGAGLIYLATQGPGLRLYRSRDKGWKYEIVKKSKELPETVIQQ